MGCVINPLLKTYAQHSLPALAEVLQFQQVMLKDWTSLLLTLNTTDPLYTVDRLEVGLFLEHRPEEQLCLKTALQKRPSLHIPIVIHLEGFQG